jgi:histone acetyltransferase (RNA polymerase elongator complex component)
LSEIAKRHGMRMFSCCGDYLVNDRIQKGHCIDGSVIESLFFTEGLAYKEKPTRKECGCTESADIGTYDTCPHGCVYCYANMNKRRAVESFRNHDEDSAFLGYSKSQSDKWLALVSRASSPRFEGGTPSTQLEH